MPFKWQVTISLGIIMGGFIGNLKTQKHDTKKASIQTEMASCPVRIR